MSNGAGHEWPKKSDDHGFILHTKCLSVAGYHITSGFEQDCLLELKDGRSTSFCYCFGGMINTQRGRKRVVPILQLLGYFAEEADKRSVGRI